MKINNMCFSTYNINNPEAHKCAKFIFYLTFSFEKINQLRHTVLNV